MGCCSVFALVFLITINFISFLGSGIILAFGIVAKIDPDTAADMGKYAVPEASQNMLQQMGLDVSQVIIKNAVFLIIIGSVGIFVAGFGFLGSCCTVRWMLIAYVVLMVILVIGEIAPIIFAAAYPTSFKNVMQYSMKDTLINGFRKDIQIRETTDIVMPEDGVNLAWATVQLREECCGAINSSDYTQFQWQNDVVPKWIHSGPSVVPISCCLQRHPLIFPTTYLSFVNLKGCLAGDRTLINSQNCYDAVGLYVHQYKGLAIGVAVCVVVIEVILIFTAIIRTERAHRTTKYAKFSNE